MKELTLFLQQIVEDQYKMDIQMIEEIARVIIQTFRPGSGKKREHAFFNWETKKEDSIYFSILKANSFDVKTNSQYYTLDEDGLELIFATKEFYSEFQLSINQLMLRKQLEKGEFKGALRQINEMRLDVETLQDRMVKLQHEIQRNIVSEETFTRYKNLLEDTIFRLNQENEEFGELHLFIKETKDRLYYQDNEKKESNTYQLVLQISKELEEVHAEHTKLLRQSIDLVDKALRAAQESLYYIGIASFNFDQDITAKIISTPLPLETMRGILSPFLPIHTTQQWSLLTIFGEQRIMDYSDVVEHGSGFLEIDDDPNEIRYQEIQRKNYARIMQLFLEFMDNQEEYSLDEFIQKLKQTEHRILLEQRFFYDFWILLHQKSPLHQTEDLDYEDKTHILDEVVSLLDRQTLTVKEDKQLIQATPRYTIQNMMMTLGENDNG
ncbi:replicative DNA helicase [Tepidibacillus marianensis]|uniref:replicative DNA helicase n=1 Tax=Tepidibacillus marianensis TaxID=3131995 RepID=UPI0030CEF2C6